VAETAPSRAAWGRGWLAVAGDGDEAGVLDPVGWGHAAPPPTSARAPRRAVAEAPADSVDEGPDRPGHSTSTATASGGYLPASTDALIPWFQLAALLRFASVSGESHRPRTAERHRRLPTCHRRRQENGNRVDTHK